MIGSRTRGPGRPVRPRTGGFPRSKKRYLPPLLEQLEDRSVPSANIVLQSLVADGYTTLSVSYHIDSTTGAAKPFSIGVYRSADALFGKGDVLLGSISLSAAADLSAGDHTLTRVIGTEVTLPGVGAAEVESDYFILAAADPGKKVKETSEADNTKALTGAYHSPGGALFVHGEASGDAITVSPNGSALELELNGNPTLSYASATLTEVRVRTHDGTDTVDGTATAQPMFVWGGADADVLTGGAGTDHLFGGLGDDTLRDHVNPIDFGGPTYPPPGGVSFSATGPGIGRAGGRTFHFSGFDFSAFDQLFWLPVSVQLSMNATPPPPPALTASENLTFAPADPAADLANGVAIWTGSTLFTYLSGSSMVTASLPTRLRIVVTNAASAAVPLVASSTVAGYAGPAGALVVVASNVPAVTLSAFRVQMFMEANFSSSWQPVTDLFDARNTNPAKIVYTSLSGGFFATPRFLDADYLSGGEGTNTLIGNDGVDTVVATGDVNMTLAGTTAAATLTGVGIDSLVNVERAILTGGAGRNTLDAAAFSGVVTLDGGANKDVLKGGAADDVLTGGLGNDVIDGGPGTNTLRETFDANFKLSDSALVALGTDALTNIQSANLTGGGKKNAFDVSAFSGFAALDGAGGSKDRVIASADADFTLSDTSLAIGVRLVSLAGIEEAVLSGGGGDNSFTVSGWTGKATLNGRLGSDVLVSSNDTNYTLTDATLSRSSGGTIQHAAIERAELTATGTTSHLLDAHTFKGDVVLIGGDGDDTLLAGLGDDVLNGGAGTDTLDGGPGDDTATNGETVTNCEH